METKKSLKANLEKWRTTNLLMGIVVAMATLFASFEWGTQDSKVFMADGGDNIQWIDEIPITLPEPPTPPPPPPPVIVADLLTLVDDTEEVKELPILSSEDTPDNPQTETYLPPVPIDAEEEDQTSVFIVVEDMPVFPGGDAALLKFINSAIKYPTIAQETGRQGRVVCSFVINTDGQVVDAEVVRGIDPSLDKEALRVISTMPKWEPGKQRGKPVRVKYTLPITFRLQ